MPGGLSVRDQVNVRLSDDAIAILYALQDHYGISQSAIFEVLLRDKARAEGIKPNPLVHSSSGTAKRRAHAASVQRRRDSSE